MASWRCLESRESPRSDTGIADRRRFGCASDSSLNSDTLELTVSIWTLTLSCKPAPTFLFGAGKFILLILLSPQPITISKHNSFNSYLSWSCLIKGMFQWVWFEMWSPIWLRTFVILVCMHEAAGAHFKLVSSGLSPESGLQVIFLGSTSLCKDGAKTRPSGFKPRRAFTL